MLEEFKALKAMQGIDEDILEDTAKFMGYEDKKVIKLRRKVWRTALIAAVIISMLIVTAAAVGISIHMRKQEEIRNNYNIDKNNVASYNQYSVPEKPEGKLTLLSGINDGEFYRLYADYSPISKEEMEKYILQELTGEETEFYSLGFKVEERGAEKTGGVAFFNIKDWDFRPEEMTTVTRNGETVSVPNEKAKVRKILEQSYDEETQTATLEFHIYMKPLEPGKEYELVLYSLREYGEPAQGLMTERREELARAKFIPSEAPAKILRFPEAVELTGERGQRFSFTGCELYSTGVIWYVESVNADKIFDTEKYNRQEMSEKEREEILRLEADFINDVEDYERTAFLTMKDGSIKDLTNGNSGGYFDGIYRPNCFWGGTETVDVNEVESITVGGKTILISECTDKK